MRRRTRVQILLFGVLALTGGPALAWTSSGADRGFYLIGVIPLGIGMVALAVAPLVGRGQSAVRLEEIRGRRSGPAVFFPFSSTRQRLAFVGQASFILMGLSFILYPDAIADGTGSSIVLGLVGVLCVSIMGLAALATVPAVLGRASGVALLPEGLLIRGAPTGGFLPWEEIAELQDLDANGSTGLGITASDLTKLEIPPAARLLHLANRAFGYRSDLSVLPTALIADLETVAAAIEHEIDHPAHRSRLGTAESLSDLGLTEIASAD